VKLSGAGSHEKELGARDALGRENRERSGGSDRLAQRDVVATSADATGNAEQAGIAVKPVELKVSRICSGTG